MSELFSEAEKKLLIRYGKDITRTELQLKEYCTRQLISKEDKDPEAIVRLKQQLIKNLLKKLKKSVSLSWEPSESVYKQLLKDGYMIETIKYLLDDVSIKFKLGYINAVDLDAYSLEIVRRSAVIKKTACKFDEWKIAGPFRPPTAVINELFNRLNLNPIYKWSENDRERLVAFYHFKLEQKGMENEILDHDENFTDMLVRFCRSGLKINEINI